MHLILCILSFHILFSLGKPAKLFETTRPDWAPSLHLGNENHNSCKISSAAAAKRYEKSVKRTFLGDTHSPNGSKVGRNL